MIPFGREYTYGRAIQVSEYDDYISERDRDRAEHAVKVAKLNESKHFWQEVTNSEYYYAGTKEPRLRTSEGYRIAGAVLGGLVAIFIFALSVLAIGTTIDRHAVKGQCESKGVALGINTHYVEHSFWNYDCYGEVLPGRFVPTDDINPSELFVTGQAVTITPRTTQPTPSPPTTRTSPST